MNVYIEDLIAALEVPEERPVLRCDGIDTTAVGLLAAVRRTARALDGLGVGRGDLVALLAPNRPEALAVRYAAHLIGTGAAFLSVPPDPTAAPAARGGVPEDGGAAARGRHRPGGRGPARCPSTAVPSVRGAVRRHPRRSSRPGSGRTPRIRARWRR